MLAETTMGKPIGRSYIFPITDCDIWSSSQDLSHGQVYAPEQTLDLVGDVGTKRNTVEECLHPRGSF